MFNNFGLNWFTPDYAKEIQEEMGNLIMSYVPEAEFLPYWEALELAYKREQDATEILLNSLVEGGVM